MRWTWWKVSRMLRVKGKFPSVSTQMQPGTILSLFNESYTIIKWLIKNRQTAPEKWQTMRKAAMPVGTYKRINVYKNFVWFWVKIFRYWEWSFHYQLIRDPASRTSRGASSFFFYPFCLFFCVVDLCPLAFFGSTFRHWKYRCICLENYYIPSISWGSEHDLCVWNKNFQHLSFCCHY